MGGIRILEMPSVTRLRLAETRWPSDSVSASPWIWGPLLPHEGEPRARKLREKPTVPMSCLYSLSDGVVPPQEATIEGDPALHENIRIPGSHIGLGFNPMVLWLVAERLSQPEGAWRPFAPQGAPGWLYRLLTHEALPI